MSKKTDKAIEKIRNRDGRAAAERVREQLRQAAREGRLKQATGKLAK